MPEMVVLCHSPVQADDPAACAPAELRLPAGITAQNCQDAEAARLDPTKDQNATNSMLGVCNAALSARRGDMRFNQINALTAPQTPSPWGIMVDSDDPLTGEKVATSVNVWTHVNDLWSQSVIDNIRYINGELKTSDVTDGTYINNWAQAFDASQRTGAAGMVSAEEYDKRIAGFAGLDPQRFEAAVKQLNPNIAAQMPSIHERFHSVAARADVQPTSAAIYDGRRRSAMQHPEFESQLITPAMMQYAGVDKGAATDVAMDLASPLRGANPSVQESFDRMKQLALAQRGACMMTDEDAPAPFSMAALGKALQEKFGNFNPSDNADVQQARAEKMRQFVAQRAQYAVIAHEMGHSIGLRHNFISSYNAWGYRPQYWQLRTKDGSVKKLCTQVTADGESCVGPRWFDPVTPTERDNLIWSFMQSSIMDYAGEGSQDLVGIGAYDYAAPRMFYGDVVAVHKDPSYNSNQPRGKGMIAQTDEFGGLSGLQSKIGTTRIHYSELQNRYDLISNCAQVDAMAFKPAYWNTDRDGEWHPTLDGLIVKGNGTDYSKCQDQKVDYVPWTKLRTPTPAEGGGPYYRGANVIEVTQGQSFGRTRVPYGFATDTWADLGNLSVYRHDNGADPYELFNFMISQQEINHIFDNYRRGRHSFSVRAAADRTLKRYNKKMRDGAKGLTLIANIYRDVAEQNGEAFEDVWPGALVGEGLKDNVFAAGLAFDHFARELARPEPGDHFSDGEVLRNTASSYTSGATQITVPNGPSGYYGLLQGQVEDIGLGGKPIENALPNNKGEYQVDYTMNCGSYYEKANSAMLLTESVDNFISATPQDFTDARYRNSSIADLFRDGYRRWLGNNLTGDDFIKGPRVAADGTGKPLVKYDKVAKTSFPTQPIAWTSWWTPTPQACFPAAGTNICFGEENGAKNPLNPQMPMKAAVLDPQVSWEQQKFLIAWTMQYLPENSKQFWLNQMRIFELGSDADPGTTTNRIEFHDPYGKVYVADTFGKEMIFGKQVQMGIGARMLEWANVLLQQGFETTPGPDLDKDGTPDWYIPDFTNGQPTVTDPGAKAKLEKYTEVLFFMRQAIVAYGLGDPDRKGLIDPSSP
jgi:hypothetical protein